MAKKIAKKRGRPRKEPIEAKKPKKRGRPKGSKNKIKKLPLNDVVKKKRGRPKGSKNKVKKLPLNDVVKKKRGRPKKVSTVSKVTKKVKKKISTESKAKGKRGRPAKKRVIEEVDLSQVTFSKHLGYCPDCHGMISDRDYEEGKKTIFVCYKCQYRGRISTLLKDRETKKVKSKKAFLAETIVTHNEGDDYEPDIPNEFQAVPEDEWN